MKSGSKRANRRAALHHWLRAKWEMELAPDPTDEVARLEQDLGAEGALIDAYWRLDLNDIHPQRVIDDDGATVELSRLPTDGASLEELLSDLFRHHWQEIAFGPLIQGATWEMKATQPPDRIKMFDGYLTAAFGVPHFHICIGEHKGPRPRRHHGFFYGSASAWNAIPSGTLFCGGAVGANRRALVGRSRLKTEDRKEPRERITGR